MTLGPTNIELAEALEQMADLLLRTGETNPYRVQAYTHAAETIRAMREPLALAYAARGRDALTEIDGVGERLSAHLAQYIETGRTGLRDRLLSVADPVALLATLPAVSPRLAARFVDELDVRSLAELERAALDGRLAAMPGIGPRTVEAIRLQVNSVLSRSARRRARRVRRQTLQMASAPSRHETALRNVEGAGGASSPVAERVADPTVGPSQPPMATIYTLFPPAAA